MITFIIFGIAAVTALEIALCLVLLGLAAGARHIWPAAKSAAKSAVAGRWVAR
ncbi:hypothetical protein [Nonomuraea sp. NPDC003709]|uniref:hypothetical protein n=1 Tax=Nonomuraea sp. NPDC003709 TaxID=3154450 RepID=UPI0033A9CDE3